MFPPFHRATRRFLGDYLQVIEKTGFVVEKLHRLREADAAYLQSIRPKLRKAASAVPLNELALIEFAVTLRRPWNKGTLTGYSFVLFKGDRLKVGSRIWGQ